MFLFLMCDAYLHIGYNMQVVAGEAIYPGAAYGQFNGG